MTWQKCPVCDGKGVVHQTVEWGHYFFYTSQNPNQWCHTCAGNGILNELTGRPPVTTVIKTEETERVEDKK